MAEGLQTIHYHQGLMTFSIPEDWTYGFDVERNEAVFYQEREGAGVLRLHYARIVPFNPVEKSVADLASEFAEAGDISSREDGSLMCTRTEQIEDPDQPLLVFHWHSISQVDDNYVRMAHLSYTVSFEELNYHEFPYQLETLSKELTLLAWSHPEEFYDKLRTVLSPVQTLNDSIVQYGISEQVSMAIACAVQGSDFMDFVPYSDLEAWCIPADEAWRRAFENMDRLLAETPVTVEELVDGVPMAFFETSSVWQAALITAPSLRTYVENSIGWPVQALLPCQDFLHLIPAGWAPDYEQTQALAALVIDEYMNSPCALSTELFAIDDQGIHATGRFQTDGFVVLEANGAPMDDIEQIVQSAYPNPVHAHDFYNRGVFFSTMLQHERAIENFTRAIELEPGVADYYRSRAVEYELMGDNDRANQDSHYASSLG